MLLGDFSSAPEQFIWHCDNKIFVFSITVECCTPASFATPMVASSFIAPSATSASSSLPVVSQLLSPYSMCMQLSRQLGSFSKKPQSQVHMCGHTEQWWHWRWISTLVKITKTLYKRYLNSIYLPCNGLIVLANDRILAVLLDGWFHLSLCAVHSHTDASTVEQISTPSANPHSCSNANKLFIILIDVLR